MPERASAKSMSIAAMGEALDGNDGIYENVDALVEAIIGSPPRYGSPSTSADYLAARTVELCDLMQMGEMLTHIECVEVLGDSKRSDLDRSRAEPPDVVFWRETPRLILMQHRREGKFVRVLGNVSTVRIDHGPVKWLLGLRATSSRTHSKRFQAQRGVARVGEAMAPSSPSRPSRCTSRTIPSITCGMCAPAERYDRHLGGAEPRDPAVRWDHRSVEQVLLEKRGGAGEGESGRIHVDPIGDGRVGEGMHRVEVRPLGDRSAVVFQPIDE